MAEVRQPLPPPVSQRTIRQVDPSWKVKSVQPSLLERFKKYMFDKPLPSERYVAKKSAYIDKPKKEYSIGKHGEVVVPISAQDYNRGKSIPFESL